MGAWEARNGEAGFLKIAKAQEGLPEMPRAAIFRGAFWALRASKGPEGQSATQKIAALGISVTPSYAGAIFWQKAWPFWTKMAIF